jgi:xylulokinase
VKHVLGIDVGTSSCKLTLLDPNGLALSSSSEPYGFATPLPEWAEQDAVLWRRGAIQGLARMLAAADIGASDIAAVGMTGQMHSAVLLDERRMVIRPPLLWCDQRPVAEAAAANAAFPRLRELTLNPLLPAFTLSKLLWSRQHEPASFARIRHVCLPKDLLRFWLTGALATDPSDAAGTALFDAHEWRWSEEIREHFGIPAHWLPEVRPSATEAGRVSATAAREFGLTEGTPVVTGAGDQAAQALGLGAVDGRVLALQIGTSGVIVATATSPVPGSFCHAVEGRWIRLDSLHSAGSSLLWIRDAFGDAELESLLDEAAEVPPGAEGMLYLPFLMGERAGFGSSVPAAFVNLRPGHGRAHFVRAVLEGVAFELRRMFDRWSLGPHRPVEIRVAGGGARHPLLLRILADVFGLPVLRLERDSSHGAAVLAGIGLGWWQSAPEAPGVTPTRPTPDGAAEMADGYERYRRLYDLLAANAGDGGTA